jgi:oligopeptide transport system substrate-binding protein
MKKLVFIGISLLASLALSATFKITIGSFMRSLQPQLQTSAVSYVSQNLFRNLFIYDQEKGLLPDLAQNCKRKNAGKTLVCTLKKDLKWNNGTTLVAQDFVDTYQKILDSKNKFLRPDLLFTVKNAKEIYLGSKPASELGVKALSKDQIQFEFTKSDQEFEHNLSSFYLSPTKGEYELKEGAKFFTNGPYMVKSWDPSKGITLESNPYYPGHPRPDVEFQVITEDTVTLRLYEKGDMSFVRRLPPLLIPKYRTRDDFVSLPVLRFDYFGMGPDLKDQPQIRKALATSLDYSALQSLLNSKGRPGCLGLPEAWFDKPLKCYELEKQKPLEGKKELKFYYSLQGGDGNQRSAEWLQAEWKKNLGINLQVKGIENKTFVAELKANPPSLYRKGLAPDRATCSGILENFTSDHPENYIQLKDAKFDKLVEELRETSNSSKKKKLCREGFETLINNYLLIPTGNYDFSMLVSKKFTGWKLNELNQLDLSHLKEISP